MPENTVDSAGLRQMAWAAVTEVASKLKAPPGLQSCRRVRSRVEWKRNDRGGREGRRVFEEYFDFVDMLRNSWAELQQGPAFSRLISAVSNKTTPIAGVPGDPCDSLIWGLVGELPADDTHVFRRFELLYPRFEEHVLLGPEKVLVHSMAPLYGLRVEAEAVDLGGGLRVAQLDDELNRWLNPDTFSMRYEDITRGLAVVECALVRRSITNTPSMWPPEQQWPPFEDFAIFARLYSRNNASVGTVSTAMPYAVGFGSRLGHPPPFPAFLLGLGGREVVIPKGEEAMFVEKYARFRRYLSGNPNRVALRWFAKGCHEHEPADRIVDFVTAMEALLLRGSGDPKDRGELSYRLSLRAAWLLGATGPFASRKETFNTMREMYRMRSTIVHGGDPSAKPAELAGLAERAETLSRQSINQWIDAALDGRRLELDDRALGCGD